MTSATGPAKDKLFPAALLTATLVGLFLRLFLFNDQVFADDEWHGLYYVLGKSPFWLLTHFSIPGATCIPLNFYTWVLGQTTGWSESLLRLPLLICGILCVMLCPIIARKIIGTPRAAWLALLLAISPILVFYSRICRPYSAVAFLGFAAILFAARWAKFGDRLSGLAFVISAILAIYFHLFAIVTTMAPILAAVVYHLYVRFIKKKEATLMVPPLRHWIIATAIIGLASAVLLLPAMIYSMRSTFFNIALTGTFSLHYLPRIFMLVAGTGQPIVITLFWGALIAGAVDVCRKNPWFGWMLLSLYPLHALALLVSRPDSAQSATVLLRYSIPLVPVSLLFVAGGIQSTLEALAARSALRPALQSAIAFAGMGALLLAGPLPQTYLPPNNFTNHGAYQQSYAPIDWSQSFFSDLTPANFKLDIQVKAEEISPFYKMLRDQPDGRPIVEYPMMIGEHFCLLYFYQYFHRRPVIVGYCNDLTATAGLAAGNIYGNTYIDQVISFANRFDEGSRFHFRNFIFMNDVPAMRGRNVEYIILHKHYEAQLQFHALPLPDLSRLYATYKTEIGPPFYEDANIAVFRL